ncbi:TIGR04282 family arsenosugar biosynthesis glycosyltransferase [Pseudonocardia hydrocarbonoxydans]|uniref:TIGR04282 family arsenosugar biosynthesis glycosyltransferase n=1 Tax=Pseudonocardia hydrocarbonoxydans TaxID=76726 RepID=UPI001580C9A5|nr:DUF2064 domain-containing protein [Pseudonocardia hydrocarbonoxydans]
MTLVVLAKAPEPGRVKTRLCPPVTPGQAADLAAAALLDTLDAARAVPGATVLVALTGDLGPAARSGELAAALRGTVVVAQRGDGLGERIAAAHADAAARAPGLPSLQVGMDTPQLDGPLLAAAAARLHREGGPDAVLGPASDGGWWALGLRDPRHAALVAGVPTSRADTGERTLHALRAGGLRVELLAELRDVDTAADAVAVAAAAPHSRLAAAVAALPSLNTVVRC